MLQVLRIIPSVWFAVKIKFLWRKKYIEPFIFASCFFIFSTFSSKYNKSISRSLFIKKYFKHLWFDLNSIILREGYTVKLFFQGISWNTNLTLISQCIFTLNSNQTVFYAFMKHSSDINVWLSKVKNFVQWNTFSKETASRVIISIISIS